MVEMLRLARLMTSPRTLLGLSPDLDEGIERQKHADVLFQPLAPANRSLPMSLDSRQAMRPSLVPGTQSPHGIGPYHSLCVDCLSGSIPMPGQPHLP
jgi:hypothetical protein